MHMKVKLNSWLKLARIRLGLLQEDIAQKMHTTKQTVSNIERGKGSAMVTLLYRYVIAELIAEEEEKDPTCETSFYYVVADLKSNTILEYYIWTDDEVSFYNMAFNDDGSLKKDVEISW